MATFVGAKVAGTMVPIRRQPLKLALPLLLTWWLAKTLAKISYVVVRSPVAMISIVLIVLGVVAGQQFGLAATVAGYVVLAAAVLLLWLKVPPCGRTLRNRWRRFSIYRHKWPATMDFAGLNRTRKDGTQYAPILKTVRCSKTVDIVRARMLAGQVVEDWAKVSDRLCQTFGGIDCRVSAIADKPHEVQLSFLISDPLAREVQPCYATDNLAALPVGRQEDGEPYKLELLGSHALLVGATGAGKSGVLQAVINQLRSNVSRGDAELWVLDPKGGMEMAPAARMFARFAYGTENEFADVLEDAVLVMRERQSALRGVTRLHTPTPAEPLIVIVIDELAALTGYVGDRETKRRIHNALGLLLSQGRAVGVTVLAAVQDPRKETIPDRDLFPTRILLRVTEAEHVALVMGPGARDRGARADQIPDSLPGVAFVQVDGVREPTRVRFAHITDDYIGAYFPPPRSANATAVASLAAVPELEDQAA